MPLTRSENYEVDVKEIFRPLLLRRSVHFSRMDRQIVKGMEGVISMEEGLRVSDGQVQGWIKRED